MSTPEVTAAEVIDAARRRRALLAPETAGYLVLAAADQLLRTPALVDEDRCSVQVEGGRVVVRPTLGATIFDAEDALRRLLRRLLDASSGRAPALSTLASHPAKGNLVQFISELETALIPVNRSAAGRALARLARESLRARGTELSLPDAAADDTEPMAVEPVLAESESPFQSAAGGADFYTTTPPPDRAAEIAHGLSDAPLTGPSGRAKLYVSLAIAVLLGIAALMLLRSW